MLASIVRAVRAWLTKRRESIRAQLYDEGWSWAAGQLLAGATPQEVRNQVGIATLLEGSHPFDDGALAACMVWIRLDNRSGQKDVSK